MAAGAVRKGVHFIRFPTHSCRALRPCNVRCELKRPGIDLRPKMQRAGTMRSCRVPFAIDRAAGDAEAASRLSIVTFGTRVAARLFRTLSISHSGKSRNGKRNNNNLLESF